MFSKQLNVVTDTATIAVFDQFVIQHRRFESRADWWCEDIAQVKEARAGDIALFGVGADGVYRSRVTDGELTADERAYATAGTGPLGFRAESERIFICGAENLPGAGQGGAVEGERVEQIRRGSYDLHAYQIYWFDCPRWWTAKGPDASSAPADIVICIRPRQSAFIGIQSPPQLRGYGDKWVFPDEPRQVGPQAGMELITTVRKAPSGLILKECGPRQYSAALEDYSQVQWKDQIRFISRSCGAKACRQVH
jgi:hypothetical protein